MGYLIGAVLAVAIGLLGSIVGYDRDRSFYPTIMSVIALLYALFAAISGSLQVLAQESIGVLLFLAAAVAGFRYSLWVVVLALAAHGIYDGFHGQLIVNAGVPTWWPRFCLAYDVVAAVYLAVLLLQSRVSVAPN
jgi:hypothetical protein